MVRYVIGMALGALATPAVLLSLYLGVSRYLPDHLPAPAITSLEPLDEKLRYLRDRFDGETPDVLTVGSSITWRHLDGDTLVRAAGGDLTVLNGGTGLLKTHQTRAMVQFYLDRFPGIVTIATFVGLPDFDDCKRRPASLMDPEDAAAYAFEQAEPLPLYLEYFAPVRYVRTGLNLPERTEPLTGDLWQDEYGSGPMQIPQEMQEGLRYGRIDLDPLCIDQLVALAVDMEAAGKRFVIVFAPTHPDYWKYYPGGLNRLRATIAQVKQRVRPHGAQVVDMHVDPDYLAADFWDAFHMQWAAVRRFTAEIAPALTGADALTSPVAGTRADAAPGLENTTIR